MKIKICGLRRPEDVTYANEVKPDYIGFILSPGFRRSITKETARELKALLDPEIKAVGVFVNEPAEHVAEFLEEGIIDVAQLHGHESEEDILYVKAKTGKPVIKVVKVVDRYVVEAWLDSAADYLLFDSGTGTGKTFDWSVLTEMLEEFGGRLPKEFFLAGGITAEILDLAHERINPFAVDISSGVEIDGVKDFEKMKLAVSMARKYDE
ncbi:MAG: phosphoribosylanthranilate isomerase [Lachnospiraceae bacterium]|nr:phosphoribosylanthranilate isomerase [Lachnospiraceae bacterium]